MRLQARNIQIILVSALALSSCHKKSDQESDAKGTSGNSAPMVLTEVLTAKPMFDALLYPARVEASAQAAVLSETDGLITSVKTALGRSVQKGDVLFMIENPDPVYRYAPVAVTAPVSGVISVLDASVGNRVERTKKLAVIADIREIKVLIEATSSDLASLKIGQLGDLKLIDKSYPVKVSAVSPVVDSATGTATVELKPLRGERLTPGVMGRIEFKIHEHQGFQVSDNALVFKGADPYLRVVKDNKAAWRKVGTGASVGGQTEILSGVTAGDQIIVRATSFIADGDAVQVQAAQKGEVARQ